VRPEVQNPHIVGTRRNSNHRGFVRGLLEENWTKSMTAAQWTRHQGNAPFVRPLTVYMVRNALDQLWKDGYAEKTDSDPPKYKATDRVIL
jgi:hypothetical protein